MTYQNQQQTSQNFHKQHPYNKHNYYGNQTFNYNRCRNNEHNKQELNWRCGNLSFNQNKQYRKIVLNNREMNWKRGNLSFKNHTHSKNEPKIMYKHKTQSNIIVNELSNNWNNKWDNDNLFGWKNNCFDLDKTLTK